MFQYFVKYAYSLSCPGEDEKMDATLMSVPCKYEVIASS